MINCFTICLSQNKNEIFLVYDTVTKFEGDRKLQMALGRDNSVIFWIYNKDGSFLDKRYCDTSGVLLQSTMRDKEGRMDGTYYTFNPLKNHIRYGQMDHGKLIFGYTLNQKRDTISIDKYINDTLYTCNKVIGDTIFVYDVNEVSIKNGKFQKIDKETNIVLVKGNYRAVKEDEIYDYKKFSQCAKKYNVSIGFAGKDDGIVRTSVPVGKWYFYSKDGKLINTIEYKWDGF